MCEACLIRSKVSNSAVVIPREHGEDIAKFTLGRGFYLIVHPLSLAYTAVRNLKGQGLGNYR